MNESDKFLRLFGGIFFAVGVLVLSIGVSLIFTIHEMFGALICLLIGFIFAAVGGGILLSVIKSSLARKNLKENGKRYTGKIYGYVDNKSSIMNGDYLVNIKVHYFDEMGIEREAIIPTGFTRGSGDYPIGATIDIIALGTKFTWVENSVRYEHIYREEELMDNKPIDPTKLNMVAVNCPGCGASFSAAKGYVCTCPYCGGTINN